MSHVSMYNLVSRICKVVSMVLGALGVIGSFILAKPITESGSFSIAIFLVSLICVAVFCLLVYAVGETIELLQGISDRLYSINVNTEDVKQAMAK